VTVDVTQRFEHARADTVTVTLHMCWHAGMGHDFPGEVMQAAGRLRSSHLTSPDDDYTTLHFAPSADDWNDILLVLPYCDLAYATDAQDQVIADTGD